MGETPKGSDARSSEPKTQTRKVSGMNVTTGVPAKPGPDVSNADIDLQAVSADSAYSTIVPNPDPNPDDLNPPPGPSVIEVLGVPGEKR